MDALELAVFTFLLCTGLGVAQIHIGPINELETMTCPLCDGGAHSFPACLTGPYFPCHPQEVCSIMYTGDHPVYRCQKISECEKPNPHPTVPCQFGVEVHPGQCQECCATTACVQNMTRFIQQQYSNRLLCPGHCVVTDPATCDHAGTYCADGQFCEVTFGDHMSIQGQCKHMNEMPKCLVELVNHPCEIHEHAHKCVGDCCSDATCLAKHFDPYLGISTTIQTSLPQLTTTIAPTLSPTLAPTLATGPTVKPATCYKCDGDICHHNEKSVPCPGGYCMMTVEEDTGGNRFINKRCSDETECRNAWHDGWRNNPNCGEYLQTPTKLTGHDMLCKFCCTEDHCNNQIDLQNVHKF